MEDEIKMTENISTSSLAHWGILGQKWGVRRYQNADGTLTAAGKARYYDNKFGADTKPEDINGVNSSIDKRSITEISDSELQARLNRKRNEVELARKEQEFMDLMKKPETVSKGKAFVNSLLKDVLAPSFRDAGKSLLTDSLKKSGKQLLGLEETDDEKLKKLERDLKIVQTENKLASENNKYQKINEQLKLDLDNESTRNKILKEQIDYKYYQENGKFPSKKDISDDELTKIVNKALEEGRIEIDNDKIKKS